MSTPTTNHKWDMQTLEMSFSAKTVELVFPSIMKFIQANGFRFLQNLPAILVAINEDRLSTSQILQVKTLMDQQDEAERIVAAEKVRDDEYEKQQAARKAALSLTGGHR